MERIRSLIALSVCLVTASAAYATPSIGWVFVNQPTSYGYPPSANVIYNSSGGKITIGDTGYSHVIQFDSPIANIQGNAQASAYGSNDYCAPWTGGVHRYFEEVQVVCFTSSGYYAVGSTFTVSYQARTAPIGTSTKGIAYVWDNAPTTPTTAGAQSYNSTGGTNAIVRNAAGNYTVAFPGLTKIGGNVMVSYAGTNVGFSPARCKPSGWSSDNTGTTVNVLCFNTYGVGVAVPADEPFYVSYMVAEPLARGEGSTAKTAYVLADKLTDTSSYAPGTKFQYSDFDTGKLTVQRTAKGQYTVTIPGSPSDTTATALVTAVGTNADYCNVMGWLPLTVACFNPKGDPADSKFAASFQAH